MAEYERARMLKTFNYVTRTEKGLRATGVAFENRAGKTLYINAYSSLIRSPSGEKLGIAMLTEDITERKKLEAEVQRADRLAALGQLALGISHEIRTPLGTIKALATLIKEDVCYYENDEKSIVYLQSIINEVDRLDQLSQELLDFAGKSRLGLQTVNINKLLVKVIFLGKLNKPIQRIRIEEDFQPDLPDVYGDRDMLMHAFINLFINAMEATSTEDSIRIQTFVENEWVVVRFSDSGIGIEKESLNKIFDPFYTTKDHGTGLGLSIVHTIIKNHKGHIEVESHKDRGTIFTVRLPIEGGSQE
ncbi:MAG: ATP-binding protein [Bacillota bacterium]|nr:ATP-binding protein [Bacillota bacterium]